LDSLLVALPIRRSRSGTRTFSVREAPEGTKYRPPLIFQGLYH